MKNNALIYLHIIFLVLITTNPFRFGSFSEMGNLSWYWSWTDAPANVLLFIPLGLALRAGGMRVLHVVLVGIVVSGGIELSQLFSSRSTSLIDFVLNLSGVSLACVWQPTQRIFLHHALVLTPSLWSIGLLLPKLVLLWAVTMAVVLLVVGIWLAGKATTWYERLTIIGWIALSCAPIANNHLYAAIGLIILGIVVSFIDFKSLLLPFSAEKIVLVTCGVVALLLVLAAPPFYFPLDVWRGHLMILCCGLFAVPLTLWWDKKPFC